MHSGPYHCPVEVAMEVIGGRWVAVILAHLKERRLRYSELQRLLPDISEKMLAQRLRELVEQGLVVRVVHETGPPRVDYDLSDVGRSLDGALQALYEWGEEWAASRGLVIEAPVI